MRLLLSALLFCLSASAFAGCDECLAQLGCDEPYKACMSKCGKDELCGEKCQETKDQCFAQAKSRCSLQCEQVLSSAGSRVQPIWQQAEAGPR